MDGGYGNHIHLTVTAERIGAVLAVFMYFNIEKGENDISFSNGKAGWRSGRG